MAINPVDRYTLGCLDTQCMNNTVIIWQRRYRTEQERSDVASQARDYCKVMCNHAAEFPDDYKGVIYQFRKMGSSYIVERITIDAPHP